jgi:hypothetical protein
MEAATMAYDDSLDEIRDSYLQMADPEELNRIRIFYLKTPKGGTKAAFVIDGRQYSNPKQVRRDVIEAGEELERRRLLIDVETRSIDPNTPPLPLPTWREYKRQLEPIEGLDS